MNCQCATADRLPIYMIYYTIPYVYSYSIGYLAGFACIARTLHVANYSAHICTQCNSSHYRIVRFIYRIADLSLWGSLSLESLLLMHRYGFWELSLSSLLRLLLFSVCVYVFYGNFDHDIATWSHGMFHGLITLWIPFPFHKINAAWAIEIVHERMKEWERVREREGEKDAPRQTEITLQQLSFSEQKKLSFSSQRT